MTRLEGLTSRSVRSEAAGALHDYIEAALPCFDALCAIVTQLGGLLLLDATSQHARTMDHPMLERARSEFREVREAIAALAPDARAAHHYRHLQRATREVEAGFTAIDRRLLGRLDAADPLPALRAAARELDTVTRLLPGFETVKLDESCCADLLGLSPARSPEGIL